MRRAIAALSTVALLGSLYTAPTQAYSFTDTYGHWAQAEIAAGVADGYINGFPDGTFRPNQSITRAEFFGMLSGALRLSPRPDEAAPYTHAHWAVDQGKVQASVAGGLLNPPDYANWIVLDQPITRREMVLASVRATGREGLVGSSPLKSSDAAEYAQWLRDWAATAVDGSILQGYEDGAVGLERTATRAEALVMVQRILKQVTVAVAPSDMTASPDLARYPGSGEPTWRIDRSEPSRPSFSDGEHQYDIDTAPVAYALLPAPQGAAWLVLVTEADEGESHSLWQLKDGLITEVAVFSAPIVPLDLDRQGTLWISQGADIVLAKADGQVETISVGAQLFYGDFDAAGNLWAIGQGALYRITPKGEVQRTYLSFAEQARIRHLAVAPDGSVWLMLEGADDGARVEAVRLRDGKVEQRVPVISRQFGGAEAEVQAALLNDEGPTRLLVALAPDPVLFRFDLATGTSARVVAPSHVGKEARVLPAPDGGALLQDTNGEFWRVLP